MLDFLKLDAQLSQDEIFYRTQTREFIDSQVLPRITESYEHEKFLKDLIPEFGRLKLLGPSVSGHGCPGLNATTYGLMMNEIERGDSGLRSFASVQGALCMFPISEYAQDQIKAQYLPAMARGDLIGCFGLTEPDFGSNPAGLETKAHRDGNDYVINGHKRWLTNGSMADIAIIWAKLEGKVNGFIVDLRKPGVQIRSLANRLSLRASLSAEMEFHDVRVSADHRLNIEGLKGPFSCLNNARYGIAWGALGAAEFCYEFSRDYVLSRRQFAQRPLASHQLVQAKLVEMFTDINLGQLLALQLGRLKEKNQITPEQISMGKMNNVSKALNVARKARDLLGGNGILGDYHVMRHASNLESVNTYEGTEDIHRLVLGAHITGIPAFQ